MTKDEFMARTDEGDWRYIVWHTRDHYGQYKLQINNAGQLDFVRDKKHGQVLSMGENDFVLIANLKEGGSVIQYRDVERVI